MKRILFILSTIVLLLIVGIAQAADFSWFINCTYKDNLKRQHFLLGYSSSETIAASDFYFEYTVPGPGWYFDDIQAGRHDRVVEIIFLNPPDSGFLTIRPSGASITLGYLTSAPTCTAAQRQSPQAVDKDDQGVVNDPTINDRANSCYTPGQVCVIDQDWIDGWYLIRKEYEAAADG